MKRQILNLETREVHAENCKYAVTIKAENYRRYGRILTWIAYRWFGFDGCATCNPKKHTK